MQKIFSEVYKISDLTECVKRSIIQNAVLYWKEVTKVGKPYYKAFTDKTKNGTKCENQGYDENGETNRVTQNKPGEDKSKTRRAEIADDGQMRDKRTGFVVLVPTGENSTKFPE